MLQRLQSVWLLFAAICAFLSIRLSFYGGSLDITGSPAPSTLPADSAPIQYVNAAFNIWILIITIALICGPVIDIFLYKNRKLQLRIAIVALLFSLLNIYLYYKQTLRFTHGFYALTSVLVFVIPVFLFLAARGINKDERLVKSLNRLR